MKLGQVVRPLLPRALKNKVPPRQRQRDAGRRARMRARCCCWKAACSRRWRRTSTPPRRACSTPPASRPCAPRGGGCCGAIRYHLNDHDGGLARCARNIDAWWPYVETRGSRGDRDERQRLRRARSRNTATCSRTIRQYAAKAQRISELTQRPRRAAAARSLPTLQAKIEPAPSRQASPSIRPARCSTASRLRGAVENLLARSASTVAPFAESHLCCGSAGTYSVLQPELAYQLRDRKLGHLQAAAAGCDRVGQHRLHHASAERHHDAGDALDRVAGRAAASYLKLSVVFWLQPARSVPNFAMPIVKFKRSDR